MNGVSITSVDHPTSIKRQMNAIKLRATQNWAHQCHMMTRVLNTNIPQSATDE